MTANRWDDLKPRVLSAIVMATVGAVCVYFGGIAFSALISVSAGLMLWELRRMIEPSYQMPALQAGLAGFLAVAVSAFLPIWITILVLSGTIALLTAMTPNRWVLFGIYSALILTASLGFIHMRNGIGLTWMLWMITVVIASDTFGYLAGRLIGGPKFWPKISPKKTWSGTVAGWLGAALVGLVFSTVFGLFQGLWGQLALLSMVTAFSAQMGDIGESAIKRICGIKDSSNLIPGHGGVLDRFDGMIGASLFLVLLILGFAALSGGA